MLRCDVVLFDVDGTLLDSAQGIIETLRYSFSEMGTDISGVDLRRYLGPPLRVTYAEYYEEPEKVEQAVALYRERYAADGSHKSPVYPGAAEMLAHLKAAGVQLCTATSKPVQVVTPILKEQGICHFFDVVGGASMDESIDTKEAVIRNLIGRPEFAGKRILMVGDRRDDLLGAAACGLPGVGVLFGYGSREELEACPHLALLSDYNELENYILNGDEYDGK